MANIDQRHRPPKITPLYGDRTRVEYICDAKNYLDTKGEVDATLFLAPGSADKIFTACFIVGQGLAGADSGKPNQLVRTFETLTNELVDAERPKTDTELNGLRRVTRKLIGFPDIDWAASFVEGTTTLPVTGEVLAKVEDQSDEYATRLVATYLEPGIVSKSKSGSPASLPGTVRHTWQVWALTAAETGMPGVLTDEDEDNVGGYPVRRFTSLSSAGGESPAGTLASYPTTLEITRHGTVQVAVSADAGGDTPYLVQTPPRSGRIAATVTVELTTTPAAPVPVAFNLDNLSVSVLSKVRTRAYIGADPSSTIEGGVYSERIQMAHTTLRGYVLLTTGGHNGVEQEYSYPSAVNADGDTIAGEAFHSFVYHTITLSGSGSGSAPAATGLYSRDVEPAFTALDGTKWYRVTSISIA